ncbi:MAG: Ribose/xylose/arabinose/galactoside ABC-type transport system, permease component, partial [Rhodobacteraceae bacterium HLUCCA24]
MAATDTGQPGAAFDWFGFLARWGTLISLVLLIAFFSLARPEVFPTMRNTLNILNQVSILGIIALGLTVCLVVGLFDLSIGAMATFGGYFAARILAELGIESGWVVAGAVLAVLILAMLIGMINGALVSYLGISAIVETLAMSFIVTGVILGVSGARTVFSSDIPESFQIIGQGTILGVPNPILIMIATALLLWVFLEHTQPGRNMYAIGGNREAARLSGINFQKFALIAMGISAGCAALGGLVAGAVLAL